MDQNQHQTIIQKSDWNSVMKDQIFFQTMQVITYDMFNTNRRGNKIFFTSFCLDLYGITRRKGEENELLFMPTDL